MKINGVDLEMSSRVTRRVMEMTDPELAAVLAVAMPKSTFDGVERDARQEAILKWLFAHGLSMNHEFMLDIEDDDIYVLMRNKPCTCCPKTPDPPVTFRKDGEEVTLPVSQEKDSSGEPPTANGLSPPEEEKRKMSNGSTSSPQTTLAERRGQKVQPITTQPQPMAQTKKQEPDPEEGCWRTCWREYGTCCVGLWGNC